MMTMMMLMTKIVVMMMIVDDGEHTANDREANQWQREKKAAANYANGRAPIILI